MLGCIGVRVYCQGVFVGRFLIGIPMVVNMMMWLPGP